MIAELVMAAWLTVSPLPSPPPSQAPSPPPTRAQRPRANLSQYFSTDDYPADAVRRRAEGTVSFRLDIDRTGRVVGCTITRSSNDASLDAVTCPILRERAQYEPARDERGRAVAGTDTGRVTWRLPQTTSGGFPFSLTRIVTRLRWDGSGGTTCLMTVNGVDSPEVSGECGFLRGSGAVRLLAREPGPAVMTMVFTVEPASATPPAADETGLGELWAATAAEFSIAPDGNVGECRTTRRDLRPANLFAHVPDPCERARLERLFEPATGTAARNVRLSTAVYVQRAAAASGAMATARPPAAGPPPMPLPPPVARRARALRPLVSLFTMDDYPNEAFEAHAEGTVEVGLAVGRDGAPTRCDLTRSSGSEPLDRASCRILLERARFSPGLDAAGRPVEDRVSSRISWRLPAQDDDRNPFIALLMFTEVTVAADGSVRCRERLNAYDYGQVEEPCGDFAALDPRSLLGGPGRAGTATLILAILPDGAAPLPGDGVERGAPVLDGAARLSVAASGRVADCRMTLRPDSRGDAGLAQLADLCRLPSFNMENLFRPDPLRAEVRGATLTLQLYIRRAPD